MNISNVMTIDIFLHTIIRVTVMKTRKLDMNNSKIIQAYLHAFLCLLYPKKMLSRTFETAFGYCKFAHLSHLRTILLRTIPTPRISIMNSIIRPRRSTSCLTDRGGDSAASGVSSWHRLSVSRSELNSSWFMLLDAAMLT